MAFHICHFKKELKTPTGLLLWMSGCDWCPVTFMFLPGAKLRWQTSQDTALSLYLHLLCKVFFLRRPSEIGQPCYSQSMGKCNAPVTHFSCGSDLKSEPKHRTENDWSWGRRLMGPQGKQVEFIPYGPILRDKNNRTVETGGWALPR